MNGEDRRLQPAKRLDGLCHRVRDVVQLQVKEDGKPDLAHVPHPLRAVRHEEFKAELQAAHMVPDARGHCLCTLQIRRIDGDEDAVGHASGDLWGNGNG